MKQFQSIMTNGMTCGHRVTLLMMNVMKELMKLERIITNTFGHPRMIAKGRTFNRKEVRLSMIGLGYVTTRWID